MPQPSTISNRPSRRPDLDWVRVLCVLLLVPVHSANIFNPDPVIVAYVKDSAQIDFLVQLKDLFFSRWRLETLFLIAGAVSWHALARRSSWQYLSERFTRLMIPFLLSLLVLLPLMVNVRWIGDPNAPSIPDMYARFFTQKATDLTGMDGHFTPSHLWFVLYLFLFSLVGLPLFQLLRRPPCQRVLAWLTSWSGTIYLFVVPLTLGRAANLFGLGDKDPLYYFLIFVFGYAVISQPRFQETTDRYLPLSVALAVAATLTPLVLFPGHPVPGTTAELSSLWLFRLSQWTWVLAALGAGHRWLNNNSPLLRYASEAIYPVYILHLPVATLVAYYVIQLDVSPAAKYTLIVLAAIGLTFAIYELAVKRVNVLRFCFGMKRLKGAAQATELSSLATQR